MTEAYVQGEVNPYDGVGLGTEKKSLFHGGGRLLKRLKKKKSWDQAKAKRDQWASPQAVQARIARAQWNDFKTRYVPVENKFMQLVRRGEDDKSAARGVAAADVTQNFDSKAQQLSVQNVLNGSSVGSSGNTLAALDMAIEKGGAMGASTNDATRTMEDLDMKGRQKIVALGRNQADSTNLGLRQAAVLSAHDSAGRADESAMRLSATAGAAGSVIGGFAQSAQENVYNAAQRNKALDSASTNPNSSYITRTQDADGQEWQRFNYGR